MWTKVSPSDQGVVHTWQASDIDPDSIERGFALKSAQQVEWTCLYRLPGQAAWQHRSDSTSMPAFHTSYPVHVPSVSTGGSTVFSRGFGLASYELEVPMRNDQRYVLQHSTTLLV
jgi:hypothetical protein